MSDATNIWVQKITDFALLELAMQIRKEVFVKEQKVPEADEIDQFESIATHFLAFYQDTPAGAARWRKTEKGIKLERFAVLKEFRSKGVGAKLVASVLQDIRQSPENQQLLFYLNAQVSAVQFYQKFGFQQVGEKFDECGIEHYVMIRQNV